MIFSGGIIAANLPAYAVNMPLRTLAQRCKRLTPLLAAPAALLLTQGQAKAVLTYNIFESGGNVVVQTTGSLNLAGATPGFQNKCGYNGAIISIQAVICTGPGDGTSEKIPFYPISGGPASFNGDVVDFSGSSPSGIPTMLLGAGNVIGIPSAYVSGDPIVSSSTFTGQTLASLGFTISSGLLGSWTLNGTTENIFACLGTDPCAPPPSGAAAPGPLPLLGAGAAFGWSRRLRKRITSPLITPPQA
jgi:MYXO-CTERM domain-containing protein